MIKNENLDKLIEFVKSMKEDEIKDLEEALDELKKANGKNENPFDVGMQDEAYYGVGFRGINEAGYWDSEDIAYFVPCKDKRVVEERQKRGYLNALLEKFAYENDANVTEDMWKDVRLNKFFIKKSAIEDNYIFGVVNSIRDLASIYFTSDEICRRAITEIVIPFMEGSNE